MEINRELIEGVGIVTPPRRANAPRPQPRSRVVGTALDDSGVPVFSDKGRATVKVTRADGSTTFEPAAGFKRARTSNTRVAQNRRPVNYALEHHMMSADLPAIQNYEED